MPGMPWPRQFTAASLIMWSSESTSVSPLRHPPTSLGCWTSLDLVTKCSRDKNVDVSVILNTIYLQSILW